MSDSGECIRWLLKWCGVGWWWLVVKLRRVCVDRG